MLPVALRMKWMVLVFLYVCISGLMGSSVKLGAHVGYSVRFDDMSEPGTTFLSYLTDGILLREATSDPNLEKYSTIVLDEVHERTLASDILMSFLKALLKKRVDLKIIIMSATVDTLKLQRFFNSTSAGIQVPIFTILGRNFPVEVRFSFTHIQVALSK
jgi:pre-mRNA-splicing factor ATP-dependent RNA helicase DHX15/PRP43